MRTRASASSDSTSDATFDEVIDLGDKFDVRDAGLSGVIFRIIRFLEIPPRRDETQNIPQKGLIIG